MRAIVIIPARYASTRFPGKPLARETGKYLIEHVVERAGAARRPERVIVATDDERIAAACREFGAEVAMTPAGCPSGTDRVARAAAELRCDVVVNVQGDEPELDPDHLDLLIGLFDEAPPPDMATLAYPLRDAAAFTDPNVVKVVVDGRGRALYFSRAPIPHPRGVGPAGALPPQALGHIGVYAFRRPFLETFAGLAPTPLERTEQLEQLRALEHGYTIRVAVVEGAAPGVDTPGDYRAFVARARAAAARGGGQGGGAPP